MSRPAAGRGDCEHPRLCVESEDASDGWKATSFPDDRVESGIYGRARGTAAARHADDNGIRLARCRGCAGIRSGGVAAAAKSCEREHKEPAHALNLRSV